MPSRRQKRENIKQYRQNEQQNNTRMLQKKNLATDVADYVAMTVFFLVLLCVVIALGVLWESSVLYAAIPLIAAVIVCVFEFVCGLRIFRAFRKIDSVSTEERTVCVQKVSAWTAPGWTRFTGWLRCIIIIGENREKYCYVFPFGIKANTDYLKIVREHCMNKTIKISCYQNTKFISEFTLSDVVLT